MQNAISIRLKAETIVIRRPKKDNDERIFWTIATSQVVDTQKEIIDMKTIKALMPIIKKRGMAVNLGHFGINVGHAKECYLKTFAEIMKAFPENKEVQKTLSKYDPKTPAMVSKAKIYRGNAYDDMAWKMLKSGKINGTSVGLQLAPTTEVKCDSGGCGKVMKAEHAMFELALTGEGLDFPIQSYDPSNPTSLILGMKTSLKAKERSPKGGINLGGKDYPGGQFIPGEDLAKMSKDDRKKLDKAQADEKKGKKPKKHGEKLSKKELKPWKQREQSKKDEKTPPPPNSQNPTNRDFLIHFNLQNGKIITDKATVEFNERHYVRRMEVKERVRKEFSDKDLDDIKRKWDLNDKTQLLRAKYNKLTNETGYGNRDTLFGRERFGINNNDDEAVKQFKIDATKRYKDAGGEKLEEGLDKAIELDLENQKTESFNSITEKENKISAEVDEKYRKIDSEEWEIKNEKIIKSALAAKDIREALINGEDDDEKPSKDKHKKESSSIDQAFDTLREYFKDSTDIAKHIEELKIQQHSKEKDHAKIKASLNAIDNRLKAQKMLSKAGSDVRKFLASKMGLPDAQLDRIAETWDVGKVKKLVKEFNDKKKELSESEKVIAKLSKEKKPKKQKEEAKKKLEVKKKQKAKNKKADVELSEKIKKMKPHEVDMYVNNMFKAHLKTKANNINVSELELKAKFDKYIEDPSQRRGRPRKEKGKPQTEKHVFLDKPLPEYGSKFDGDYGTPLTVTTKNIRKDLNFLKDKGFKVSVKKTSSETTIQVKVEPPIDFVAFNPDYDQQIAWELGAGKRTSWDSENDPREVYTEDGKNLLELVKAIGNQYNGGNVEANLSNFYLFVDINRPREPSKEEEKLVAEQKIRDEEIQTIISREKKKKERKTEDDKQTIENHVSKLNEIKKEFQSFAMRNGMGAAGAKFRTNVDELIAEIEEKATKRIGSLKTHPNNNSGAMYNQGQTQDGSPPHEGEFANAQIMKMLASIMERVQSLENMSRTEPMVQQQPQMGEQQPQMMEEGEEESDENGEYEEGEEGGEDNPFAEEGDEEEESEESNPFESDDEEEESDEDGGYEESDDDEESEDMDYDDDDDEMEQKPKSKSIHKKLDHLNTKMEKLVGTDDDEDVVSVQTKAKDKDQLAEESEEVFVDEGEHKHNAELKMANPCAKCGKKMKEKTDAVSTKADEVETKIDETKVSTKSADVGECECGKHSENPTVSEKETKPSMKTKEEKEDFGKVLEKALAKQKQEIYAELGVKSAVTPITAVDAQNIPGGAQDEVGVTMNEVIANFGKKPNDSAPSMGALLGYVALKSGAEPI